MIQQRKMDQHNDPSHKEKNTIHELLQSPDVECLVPLVELDPPEHWEKSIRPLLNSKSRQKGELFVKSENAIELGNWKLVPKDSDNDMVYKEIIICYAPKLRTIYKSNNIIVLTFG